MSSDTSKHPSMTGKKPYHVQLWELRFGGEVRTCERRTVHDLPEEFWALLEDETEGEVVMNPRT